MFKNLHLEILRSNVAALPETFTFKATTLRKSGSWIVVVLLAGGFILAGLTWWHYTVSNPSTRDAVMIVLPPSGQQEIPAIGYTPSTEQERGELEMTLLIEDFDNARKAIEQAVKMVEEQKENFSFAHDRYERLMPLVETGALDPLSASQIQSAYIAARAALAQAKYFLAQAQRDYGTPEYRSARLKLLRAQFPLPDQAGPTDFPSEGFIESGSDVPQAIIEAVFTTPAARQLKSGMLARITFPSYPTLQLQGRVSQVSPITLLDKKSAVRVKIRLSKLPTALQDRKTVACQVTVDMTISQPVK